MKKGSTSVRWDSCSVSGIGVHDFQVVRCCLYQFNLQSNF